MSRVNLLWFLNESCCIQGFGFVHWISVFQMIFIEKKFTANVYFWLRIVYLLLYSSFIFLHYIHILPRRLFSVSEPRFRKKGQI